MWFLEVLFSIILEMYLKLSQSTVKDTQVQLQANLSAKQNNFCDKYDCQKKNAYASLEQTYITMYLLLFQIIKKYMGMCSIFLIKSVHF